VHELSTRLLLSLCEDGSCLVVLDESVGKKAICIISVIILAQFPCKLHDI